MKRFFMEEGVVERQTRGAPSSVLQERVEDTVGKHPLKRGETRYIKGMPGHFITLRGLDNYRARVSSFRVGKQVVLLHEPLTEDMAPETLFLPRPPETGISFG